MSSSPSPDAPPRRRWFAGRPLRTRLVAAVLALLAAVCLVIGVASTLAIRQFLIGQLDDQLAVAADRAIHAPNGRNGDMFPPGTAAETLVARVDDGAIVDARVLEGQSLTAQQLATLLAIPVDGRPHTRNLGDLGEYRLVALPAGRGEVRVTGLPLRSVNDTIAWLINVEAAVTGAGLLVAGVAGVLIVRISLRPLGRVAATAAQVTELPLDRGEVALPIRVPEADTDPRTEVGQVGAALNRMLGHVSAALAARHASEMRVRQFVADASHELRTPLAAIRGYAEVTRRGRVPVPPDVAHALRRVESESTRMTALVDDLLLLARLDAGRPLATGPVDLSALLVDAVGDAHVAGPTHRFALDLPDEPVAVTGDGARLHQVLANLLANARTHTPPGTIVTARLGNDNGHAVLSVVDDGPGIPATQQPEVFERFSRGDSSRSRTGGGTGLGLSIVAAVVAAHRGTVAVESRPGHTEFTVRLPAIS